MDEAMRAAMLLRMGGGAEAGARRIGNKPTNLTVYKINGTLHSRGLWGWERLPGGLRLHQRDGMY